MHRMRITSEYSCANCATKLKGTPLSRAFLSLNSGLDTA